MSLTKREYFAAAALQGLLAGVRRVVRPTSGSNVMMLEDYPYDSGNEETLEEFLASHAVGYADALIAALNMPPQRWRTEFELVGEDLAEELGGEDE